MVKMRSKTNMIYAGHRYKAGTEFEASRADARVLATIKRAEIVAETIDPFAPVAEMVAPEEPRKKRAYKRRDLTAEE